MGIVVAEGSWVAKNAVIFQVGMNKEEYSSIQVKIATNFL
jgi:hypothetical protein